MTSVSANACAPTSAETFDQFHECATRLSDAVSTSRIEPITKTMSIANALVSDKKVTDYIAQVSNLESQSNQKLSEDQPSQVNKRLYRYTKKPRKKFDPRTWRTRPDPFESVSHKLRLQLELNPARTSTSLLDALIKIIQINSV